MECPHCYRQIKAEAKSCPACGGYIPPGQHLLDAAGLTEGETPKTVAPAASSRSGCHAPRLAKLGDRFNAFVLDTIVLFGLFAMADAWIFMRWSSFDKAELSLSAASLLAVLITNAAIFFIYTCVLEASCGATVGKVIVGIRVVRTGRRGALSAAAIRNLLRFVDAVGFYVIGAIVAGCSPWRQRLGDLSAGTMVVEEQFGTISRVVATGLTAAVLCGAGWAVPRICAQESAEQHAPYLNQVVVRVGRTEHAAYFRVARLQFDVQLDAKPVTTAAR
jgi:uncharacterized RDD family membrane protein YckC